MNSNGFLLTVGSSRNKKLFNTSEQDQMLLFSKHLAHVMYELIYEDPESIVRRKTAAYRK